MVTTTEQFHTTLPVFELMRIPLDVVPEGERAMEGLMVWCPRKDCARWFIVTLSWRTLGYGRWKTHVCPWCSKTARVPKLPRKEIS